jgi:hypothetical protein
MARRIKYDNELRCGSTEDSSVCYTQRDLMADVLKLLSHVPDGTDQMCTF